TIDTPPLFGRPVQEIGGGIPFGQSLGADLTLFTDNYISRLAGPIPHELGSAAQDLIAFESRFDRPFREAFEREARDLARLSRPGAWQVANHLIGGRISHF